MIKLISILLSVFLKTISPGDAASVVSSSPSGDIVLAGVNGSQVHSLIYDSKKNNEFPCSKKKKRVKGRYECLPALSTCESKSFSSDERHLVKYYPSIHTYHYFCNGKRGPPEFLLL